MDIGYEVSTAVAVFEGDIIPNSLKRLDLAGKELDQYLIRLLNERGYVSGSQGCLCYSLA